VGSLFRGLSLFEGGTGVLVPLTADGLDPLKRTYTLFSGVHWTNVINQHLLLSPVGFVTLLVMLPVGIRYRLFENPWTRFLMLGAIPWLLLSCVWASDLGAPRDWDIFAAAAVLYTLLAGTLAQGFLTSLPDRLRRTTATLLVGVSLFHTIPWVWVNAGEEAGRVRFEQLIDTQRGWGTFGHAYAIHELASYLLNHERPREAAIQCRRAAEIDPHPRYDYAAGVAFLEAGDTRNAVEFLAKAVKKNPNLVEPYIYLGMAYLRLGRKDAAIGFFERALLLKPDLKHIPEVIETLRAGGWAEYQFKPEK
jgi:hypothetical protein